MPNTTTREDALDLLVSFIGMGLHEVGDMLKLNPPPVISATCNLICNETLAAFAIFGITAAEFSESTDRVDARGEAFETMFQAIGGVPFDPSQN